ncbi:MAG: hypothetical protein N3B13_02195 [Deltaproteobacteria bacterium]|nr:hypothetical protein [Deltaproteobacteria bacterium]
MLRKTVFMSLILSFLSLTLTAEEAKEGGGMGYFMASWQSISLSGLNKELNINGLPEFSESQYAFGGGGHGIIGNFIIGGEGHGLSGESKSNNLYKVSVSGGYGLFDVGYIVFKKDGLILYPLLGIGGGGLNVTIKEKATYDFNEVMKNPKRGIDLSNGGFITAISLCADYLFSFGKDKDGSGGLMIGLRGGFLLPMYKGSNWSYNEQEITNGPSADIKGFFFRLNIGGGGISEKMTNKKGE